MKNFFITEKCVGCSACVNDCPVHAIENFSSPPKINQKICIGCGDCYEICPVGAIEVFAKNLFSIRSKAVSE